jgi:predicted nucleic acid-binding protein
MPRSFPDSGVLIDAARAARPERAKAALDYFNDPQRTYLTSPFVRLETVPKAYYTARTEELSFYDSFFNDSGVEWCRDWEQMEAIAEQEARKHGLGALDALHVAAAHLLGADELVTTEGPHKPVHRTQRVRIVYLYATVA